MKYLFIITNSYDVTTDLLISKMPNEKVFRFNFDLFNDYKIRLTSKGFLIEDPIGRKISNDEVYKVYWRKPLKKSELDENIPYEERYVENEIWYFLREIVNLLWMNNKVVLVEPFAERRVGKILQLIIASKYFNVPRFEYLINNQITIAKKELVVKSLSGEMVEKGKVLYSTKVKPQKLNNKYPWFVHEYIDAIYDVTIVVVRNKVFAFRLKRDFIKKSIDWREFIFMGQNWEHYKIPDKLKKAIFNFMNDLKLHFGRIDFLLDRKNNYYFCEINPNGQFAWLDLKNTHGLLKKIIKEISPNTPLYPIPNKHPLHGIYSK